MKYTLYIASSADDRRTAYAYMLTDFEKVVDENVLIADGKRRHDESYTGHVAMQRALRQAARKAEGVPKLTITFDKSLADPVIFELLDINPPLYPSLLRTTQRIMKRFDECKFATFTEDETYLTPQEAGVIDDCMDALEEYRTIKGRLQLMSDHFFNPSKIIK